MAAYPTTPSWSYPVVRSAEFQTLIATGKDGTEQRSMQQKGRQSFTFTYPRLTLSERDTLLMAFDAAKGSFDSTLTLSFLGDTYSNLHFDLDKFTSVERVQKQYTVTVKLSQAVGSVAAGALGADFPTLASGARVQLPYTHEHGFDVEAVQTEGARYTYYNRASAMRLWSAGGPSLDDSEAQAIWDFFLLARGRYGKFRFTDPDSGTAYSNCRFASDVIEWRYLSPRVNALDVQIQQVP